MGKELSNKNKLSMQAFYNNRGLEIPKEYLILNPHEVLKQNELSISECYRNKVIPDQKVVKNEKPSIIGKIENAREQVAKQSDTVNKAKTVEL